MTSEKIRKIAAGTLLTAFALGGVAGCFLGNAERGSAADAKALCGAFGEWVSPVPDDALEVFARATAGTPHAGLVPEKVSTQVVAGTNYRFVCSDGGDALVVSVFEPLPGRGAPEISGVVRLSDSSSFGAE